MNNLVIFRECSLLILHRITINATMWTSVVGSYVSAFGTKAVRAVAFLPSYDFVAGDVGKATGVDASGRIALGFCLTANC